MIGLSARLAVGESVSSVVSSSVAPEQSLTVGSFAVSGDSTGVMLNDVAGGAPGDYYTVSVSVITALGNTVAVATTISVADVETMARATTVLEMVRRARVRTRTENKHAVINAPPGYTYGWEYDDSDSLVSNETLVEFLNDARDEFAKRRPFRDAQSSLTKIAIKDGEIRYPYDPRIITIRHITLDGTDLALSKTTEAYLDLTKPGWRTEVLPVDNESTVCRVTERDARYAEDAQQKILILGFLPVEDGSLSLDIERLPLEKCSWENRYDIILEPDQQYLEALISWVEYKVYTTHDTQMYDATRGGLARSAFDAAIGPQLSARELNARRNMANMVIRTDVKTSWGAEARYGYERC